MSINNRYSSIVPSEMNRHELAHMITELTTSMNWNVLYAEVDVATGVDKDGQTTYTAYRVPVGRKSDYQAEHTSRVRSNN